MTPAEVIAQVQAHMRDGKHRMGLAVLADWLDERLAQEDHAACADLMGRITDRESLPSGAIPLILYLTRIAGDALAPHRDGLAYRLNPNSPM